MRRSILPSSSSSFSPDQIAVLLQKCLKQKSLSSGKQTHALLLTSGTDLNILSMDAKLVGMYASCGDLKSADCIFRKITRPNIFALNWMILSSTNSGCYQAAIRYFSSMRDSIDLFNSFTFSILLKVCIGLADLRKGKEVHCLANVIGLESEASVGNSLIDMYSKCRDLKSARKAFDKVPLRDVISWTSMICAYCNEGKIEQGIDLFERMESERIQPNEFTWSALICGCARYGDSKRAFEFFDMMTKNGVLIPDLATWNAMISGFAQSHKSRMALKILGVMLESGIRPDEVTVTGVLPLCGFISSIHVGKQIHGLVYRMNLEINPFVATALIDMYSKCGSVSNARSVFDTSPVRTIASWNAMIGCYARHGLVGSVLELLGKLDHETKIRPNEVTFVSVLSACSHGGEVETGLEIFRSMRKNYNIEPGNEHKGCVVDMLCRGGKVEEAYKFLKEMLQQGFSESMVGAFVNGCKMHGRKDLAEMMEKEILAMDLREPGGYVTLSNIYAHNGEWNEVLRVRKTMQEKDATKMPGFSRVEGTLVQVPQN